MMSGYTILYIIIAYKILTTLVLPRLYKRASDKWKLRLITFTADNDGKVIPGGGKYKLLFIAPVLVEQWIYLMNALKSCRSGRKTLQLRYMSQKVQVISNP